jgi:hypothetical protein
MLIAGGQGEAGAPIKTAASPDAFELRGLFLALPPRQEQVRRGPRRWLSLNPRAGATFERSNMNPKPYKRQLITYADESEHARTEKMSDVQARVEAHLQIAHKREVSAKHHRLAVGFALIGLRQRLEGEGIDFWQWTRKHLGRRKDELERSIHLAEIRAHKKEASRTSPRKRAVNGPSKRLIHGRPQVAAHSRAHQTLVARQV